MACVYAAMATLCAVETFGYVESDFRFIAMGIEYLAYTGILIILTYNKKDFAGLDQFGIQVVTTQEFLKLIEELS